MIILIADDDRLVRFSIKSMLGEILEDNGEIFIEAANGRDMVKLCAEKKPDVAFVDIQMPYLNGLDAISESRKYSEDTEYVIVSGYSDFEYAQKGIRLGINEYLLKPVDEDELCKVVDELKEKLKHKKKVTNSKFQLRVMEQFGSHLLLPEEDMSFQIQEEAYKYLGFVVYVKTNVSDRTASLQIQRELIKNIKKFGEEIVARKGYYAVPSTKEEFPCGLFYAAKEQKEYIISYMRKMLLESDNKNRKSFQYMMWFEADSLEQVCEICDELDDEVYTGMNYSSGKLYGYHELELDQKNCEFLKMVDDLMDAWEMADGIRCNEIMNKLWRTYKDETLDVNLNNVGRYCSFLTGGTVLSDSLKSFCKSLVEQSDQMYGNVAREENDIIEQVKKYIQEYYMNDISISQIADHYELTANYLSTVFHRKTGSKFIDYLTQVRMEAAKKLLIQNMSASVADIALMVGYNSARHFSTLFQKTTGETPTTYRKAKV